MGNQALTVNEQHIDHVSNTRIAEYQDRSLVRELTARLMLFHPAAREVGERGMLEAAQLAILMGASPIPSTNEIHIYKDNRGATTIQIGINYWRRRAIAYGGVHWVQRPRPMTVDEKELYGVAPDKRAAICKAARQADVERLQDQGLSLVDARASTTIIGLGEAHTGTYNTKHGTEYTESKNGRPLMWTAMKRAETDALKQLFPYIPGEKLDPGMGLKRSETGQIVLDDHKLMHAGDPQAAEDFRERVAAERDGYTAADANADFFDGEYTIVIEGEDSGGAPEEPEPEPEPEPLEMPDDLTDAEALVWNAAPQSFGGIVAADLDYYNHAAHVKNTLKKLKASGGLSGDMLRLDDPLKRLAVYRALVAYAESAEEEE